MTGEEVVALLVITVVVAYCGAQLFAPERLNVTIDTRWWDWYVAEYHEDCSYVYDLTTEKWGWYCDEYITCSNAEIGYTFPPVEPGLSCKDRYHRSVIKFWVTYHDEKGEGKAHFASTDWDKLEPGAVIAAEKSFGGLQDVRRIK